MAAPQPPPPAWPPAPPLGEPRPASRLRRLGAVAAVTATLAVVATVLVAALVYRPHVMRVPADSMAPTIQSGEYVVVRTTVDGIARGDVVAFRNPTEPARSHLYRVIVLPGERFAIVGGVVHVDGKALVEPYVATENRLADNYGPYEAAGQPVFVLGDNRRNGADSRYIGAIERRLIWGTWLQW